MVENVYSMPFNELIQEESEDELSDASRAPTTRDEFIARCILDEYKNGRRTKTLKTKAASLDFLTSPAFNRVVVDWSRGQVPRVFQMVYEVDEKTKEKVRWRVTGRTFEKNGFPYVTYELLAVD